MANGDILNRAIRDARRYVERGGFQTEITLTTPDGMTSHTFDAMATRHHYNVDSEGYEINSTNVYVTIMYQRLVELEYPFLTDNEVNLYNHTVSYIDISGLSKSYKIKDTRPDEVLGDIVCTCSEVE